MKALVLEANQRLVYRDVAEPKKPSPDYILIKVKASGICGSDLQRAFGSGAYHYPLIMGHEFAGIIEETASGSNLLKEQRVAVFPLIPCNRCVPCETGDYAQCINYNYLGSRCDGSFAEYIYVPAENCFPLPDQVNIIHAALAEPCAVALHGVNKLALKPGGIGAVFGVGPIGNVVAQWLKIRGCASVIVVDIDERKLKIAENMGFIVVNAQSKDPVDFIRSETGGSGADYVVEACGLPQTFQQAVQSAGRFGQVVLIGNITGQFVMGERDYSQILRKELKVYGTWNSKIVPRGKDDWSTVLKFMDIKLKIEPLISHILPLDRGPEIFRKMVNRKESYSKVVFTFNDID